jgi:hypothetical protein
MTQVLVVDDAFTGQTLGVDVPGRSNVPVRAEALPGVSADDIGYFAFVQPGGGFPTFTNPAALDNLSPVVGGWQPDTLNGANWIVNNSSGMVIYVGADPLPRVMYEMTISATFVPPLPSYCEIQVSKNGAGLGAFVLDPFSYQEFLATSDQIVMNATLRKLVSVVSGDNLRIIGATDGTFTISTAQICVRPIL